MPYKIGEVARIAKVSVRTLHHYDELGVLGPSERSEAGYRLYTDDDLEQLQQVLVFKELGFGLEEIARIVTDPGYDRRDALVQQRRLVAERLARTRGLLDLIDKTILAEEGGIRMSNEEMFEVLGFDNSQYEDEVKERWGDTDAYAESARRTKRYSKDDWARYKAEAEANGARLVELYDAGVEPTDEAAMDAAEEARLLIDKWFYPLPRENHVFLGEMYLADPRFKANYENMREGLAEWFVAAIKANADRA